MFNKNKLPKWENGRSQIIPIKSLDEEIKIKKENKKIYMKTEEKKQVKYNRIKETDYEKAKKSCLEYLQQSITKYDNFTELYNNAKYGKTSEKKIIKDNIKIYIDDILSKEIVYDNIYNSLIDALYYDLFGYGKIYFWFEKKYEKILKIAKNEDIKTIKDLFNSGEKPTELNISADNKVSVNFAKSKKVFTLFRIDEKTKERIYDILIKNNKGTSRRTGTVTLYSKNRQRITIGITVDGKKRMTIRDYNISNVSLYKLSSEYKSFPIEAIKILQSIMDMKSNTFIVGATGTGKTTLLKGMLKYKGQNAHNEYGIFVQKDPELYPEDYFENGTFKNIILNENTRKDTSVYTEINQSSARYLIFSESIDKDTVEPFTKMISRGINGIITTHHADQTKEVFTSITDYVRERDMKKIKRRLNNSFSFVILLRRITTINNEERMMISQIDMPYFDKKGNKKMHTIYEYNREKDTFKFYEIIDEVKEKLLAKDNDLKDIINFEKHLKKVASQGEIKIN